MKNIYLLITGLILVAASVTGMATQGNHQDMGALFQGHGVHRDHVAGDSSHGHGARLGNHGPFMGFNHDAIDE